MSDEIDRIDNVAEDTVTAVDPLVFGTAAELPDPIHEEIDVAEESEEREETEAVGETETSEEMAGAEGTDEDEAVSADTSGEEIAAEQEEPVSAETEVTEKTEEIEEAEGSETVVEAAEADETEGPAGSEEDSEEETPAEQQVPGPGEPAEPVREFDDYGRRIIKPYYQRAYLLYGKDENDTTLDLDGTKGFLDGIGFDGGELRQARMGKDYAESMRNAEEKESSGVYCSYCGNPIAGADFFRMPDGRFRCTNCSRTLVRSAGELKELYDKILLNLEIFFGATIKVPVTVEMLEERKLKRKTKRPLSMIDDNSILILGTAITDHKKYSIVLENAAPRLSVTATLAHELTHIWQYTNWTDKKKFKKLPPQVRLIIYEGMAKWVEIQYLYMIGENAIASREEAYTKARKDEYGLGFNLYVDRYPISRDNLPLVETPFTTDGYPIG